MARSILFMMVLLTTPCAAAQGRCEVGHGSLDLSEVTVAPRGSAPFTLAVTGAAVTARPPLRGASHRVRVRSAVVFEGETTALTYGLARPVQAAAGMLRLSPAVRLRRVRARAGGVGLTAQLGYGVSVVGVGVACDALTLGSSPEAEPTGPVPGGDGTFWIPRTRGLTFQVHPGSGRRVRVRAAIPELLSMTQLTRRGQYFRLQ